MRLVYQFFLEHGVYLYSPKVVVLEVLTVTDYKERHQILSTMNLKAHRTR